MPFMGAAVDTNLPRETASTPPPSARISVASTEALYQSPHDALKAVREDYLYWTGKLTETGLQLSFAVLAANWAVFGSVDAILKNLWSKLSVSLVVIGLGLGVAGAKWMGELHRKRIDYAESDPSRWKKEFDETTGKRDPWPFTAGIESLGSWTREAKTWLPLLAGVFFLIAIGAAISQPPSAPPQLTDAISPRLFALWDAYKNKDAAAHHQFLTDDYTAVHPDGTLHSGKPTAQQIAAAPIAGYKLSHLRVAPIGADAALVTYIAEVEIPGGNPPARAQFAVSEVWVKQRGEWLCRYYQGTLTK